MMRRVLGPELMDDPALDPRRHGAALVGLARLNRLSQSPSILWPLVRRAGEERGGRVSLLDIATGSGDVPIALVARARRAGIDLALSVCDVSETALGAARVRAARAGVHLDAWRQDAVTEPFDRRFDVVTSSLFLHHLNEEYSVAFLRNASAAAGLLLVSDLRRDALGLGLAWGCSRLATRSRVVHADAVKSVCAAYTPAEAVVLAERAGLSGATVQRCWPRRMLLSWRRT
jgi:hypothetical protein